MHHPRQVPTIGELFDGYDRRLSWTVVRSAPPELSSKPRPGWIRIWRVELWPLPSATLTVDRLQV
jgi:hypothetical protein